MMSCHGDGRLFTKLQHNPIPQHDIPVLLNVIGPIYAAVLQDRLRGVDVVPVARDHHPVQSHLAALSKGERKHRRRVALLPLGRADVIADVAVDFAQVIVRPMPYLDGMSTVN